MDDEPITRTFRIEKDYDSALREEAEELGTSVNSLANQILKKYTESERYLGKGQSITLSPRTLEALIINLEDDEIKAAGIKSGTFVPKDWLLMRGMTINSESVTWFITDVLGGYHDWFICDLHERDDHNLFHLRHVYNKKWSIFLESYIESLFIELLSLDDLECETTDTTVSFRVPMQNID